MARLLVVSNRIAIPNQSVSAGGLAVGVLAALRGPEGGVWFGWSGKTQDSPSADPEVHEKDGIRFVTIDLPTASFDKYYNGFCNGSLWPLHHYFPGAFRYDPKEFAAYMAVNRYFAEVLVKLVQDGDVIWVHDYQVIPLGALLRQAGIDARIGFFLHIPYPNIAVLRLLPNYAEWVRDMCQYDLVGFQTSEDLDGFQSAVKAVFRSDAVFELDSIKLGDRSIGVGVFPTGVDVDAVARQAEDAVRDDEQVKRLVHGILGR